MEMSVHSRNFSLNSKSDEQYFADDRNNNVKNGQNSKKLIEESNHRIEVQLWNGIGDKLQLKCKNSEKYKMECHSHDLRSNDSHSNDSVDATKNSAAINFSVDSILNSVNVAQICNKDTSKLTDTSIAIPKSTIADDFNRIYRPMPMRYVSGSTIFQGNHKNCNITIY